MKKCINSKTKSVSNTGSPKQIEKYSKFDKVDERSSQETVVVNRPMEKLDFQNEEQPIEGEVDTQKRLQDADSSSERNIEILPSVIDRLISSLDENQSTTKTDNINFKPAEDIEKSRATLLTSAEVGSQKMANQKNTADKINGWKLKKTIASKTFLQNVEKELDIVLKENPNTVVLLKLIFRRLTRKEYSLFDITYLHRLWRKNVKQIINYMKTGCPLRNIDRTYISITKKIKQHQNFIESLRYSIPVVDSKKPKVNEHSTNKKGISASTVSTKTLRFRRKAPKDHDASSTKNSIEPKKCRIEKNEFVKETNYNLKTVSKENKMPFTVKNTNVIYISTTKSQKRSVTNEFGKYPLRGSIDIKEFMRATEKELIMVLKENSSRKTSPMKETFRRLIEKKYPKYELSFFGRLWNSIQCSYNNTWKKKQPISESDRLCLSIMKKIKQSQRKKYLERTINPKEFLENVDKELLTILKENPRIKCSMKEVFQHLIDKKFPTFSLAYLQKLWRKIRLLTCQRLRCNRPLGDIDRLYLSITEKYNYRGRMLCRKLISESSNVKKNSSKKSGSANNDTENQPINTNQSKKSRLSISNKKIGLGKSTVNKIFVTFPKQEIDVKEFMEILERELDIVLKTNPKPMSPLFETFKRLTKKEYNMLKVSQLQGIWHKIRIKIIQHLKNGLPLRHIDRLYFSITQKYRSGGKKFRNFLLHKYSSRKNLHNNSKIKQDLSVILQKYSNVKKNEGNNKSTSQNNDSQNLKVNKRNNDKDTFYNRMGIDLKKFMEDLNETLDIILKDNLKTQSRLSESFLRLMKKKEYSNLNISKCYSIWRSVRLKTVEYIRSGRPIRDIDRLYFSITEKYSERTEFRKFLFNVNSASQDLQNFNRKKQSSIPIDTKEFMTAIERELDIILRGNPKISSPISETFNRLVQKEYSRFSFKQLYGFWRKIRYDIIHYIRQGRPLRNVDHLYFSITNKYDYKRKKFRESLLSKISTTDKTVGKKIKLDISLPSTSKEKPKNTSKYKTKTAIPQKVDSNNKTETTSINDQVLNTTNEHNTSSQVKKKRGRKRIYDDSHLLHAFELIEKEYNRRLNKATLLPNCWWSIMKSIAREQLSERWNEYVLKYLWNKMQQDAAEHENTDKLTELDRKVLELLAKQKKLEDEIDDKSSPKARPRPSYNEESDDTSESTDSSSSSSDDKTEKLKLHLIRIMRKFGKKAFVRSNSRKTSIWPIVLEKLEKLNHRVNNRNYIRSVWYNLVTKAKHVKAKKAVPSEIDREMVEFMDEVMPNNEENSDTDYENSDTDDDNSDTNADNSNTDDDNSVTDDDNSDSDDDDTEDDEYKEDDEDSGSEFINLTPRKIKPISESDDETDDNENNEDIRKPIGVNTNDDDRFSNSEDEAMKSDNNKGDDDNCDGDLDVPQCSHIKHESETDDENNSNEEEDNEYISLKDLRIDKKKFHESIDPFSDDSSDHEPEGLPEIESKNDS